MKDDFRGPFFAGVAILMLGFGMFWGLAVSPKKDKFWDEVDNVTNVSGAHIKIDGRRIDLSNTDAQRIFDLMRESPDYSPNHPEVKREGFITFDTDNGDIRFALKDTSNQGVLLWAFSSGDTGWNYGTKRCDELGEFMVSPKGE